MKYVYKVVGNFSEDNFDKILTKISKKFVTLYVDKTLYIALKSFDDYEGSEDLIRNTFKPVRDFYVEEVTEKNIVNQHPFSKDWCLNNLVKLDTEHYEHDNQAKLREVWMSMDRMEEELSAKLIEKNKRKEE